MCIEKFEPIETARQKITLEDFMDENGEIDMDSLMSVTLWGIDPEEILFEYYIRTSREIASMKKDLREMEEEHIRTEKEIQGLQVQCIGAKKVTMVTQAELVDQRGHDRQSLEFQAIVTNTHTRISASPHKYDRKHNFSNRKSKKNLADNIRLTKSVPEFAGRTANSDLKKTRSARELSMKLKLGPPSPHVNDKGRKMATDASAPYEPGLNTTKQKLLEKRGKCDMPTLNAFRKTSGPVKKTYPAKKKKVYRKLPPLRV